jgi:hypothetical protein
MHYSPRFQDVTTKRDGMEFLTRNRKYVIMKKDKKPNQGKEPMRSAKTPKKSSAPDKSSSPSDQTNEPSEGQNGKLKRKESVPIDRELAPKEEL